MESSKLNGGRAKTTATRSTTASPRRAESSLKNIDNDGTESRWPSRPSWRAHDLFTPTDLHFPRSVYATKSRAATRERTGNVHNDVYGRENPRRPISGRGAPAGCARAGRYRADEGEGAHATSRRVA